MTSPEIGIGIAGIGRWGSNYLRTLAGLPDCQVIAVADPSQTEMAKCNWNKKTTDEHRWTQSSDPKCQSTNSAFDIRNSQFGTRHSPFAIRHSPFNTTKVFPDAADMLAMPGLDAVVIATPDPTHFQFARQALEAGLDVLVEKPMVAETWQAEELVRLARDRELILAVGHITLYNPGLDEIRTAVRERPRPLLVETVRTSTGPRNRDTDVLRDLAPHDLALAIELFGEPRSARARGDGKDAAVFELTHDNDTTFSGSVAWHSDPPVRRLAIADSARCWDEQPGLAAEPVARPLTRQCSDFISCCRSRTTPLSSGRLGVLVTKWLGLLAESARQDGRRLEWSSTAAIEAAVC